MEDEPVQRHTIPRYNYPVSSGSEESYSENDTDIATGLGHLTPASSGQSYYEDIDEDENGDAFSYFAAAAASVSKSPGDHSASTVARRNSSGRYKDELLIPTEDLLDIPVEETGAANSFEMANYGHSNKTYNRGEETIVFDESSKSLNRTKKSRDRRANQDYYDILEVASDRLKKKKSKKKHKNDKGRNKSVGTP